MTILIIARGYPTQRYPMNGVFEYDQAKALQGQGCKVIYVSIDLRSFRRIRKWGFYHFIDEGLEVFNFSFPIGGFPRVIRFICGKIGLRVIYNRLKQKYGQPDIMHAHCTSDNALHSNFVDFLKKKYGIPFVITEHRGRLTQETIQPKLYNQVQKIYQNANAVIAVSSALAAGLKKHAKINAAIIPNIVSLKIFACQTPSKKNPDIFRFIAIGGLGQVKGFDLLIQSFAEAFSDSTVRLDIIGEGNQRGFLQNLIDKLNLREQIKLLGLKTREEIANEFCQSDVMVISSRFESFGVVGIEALASGLPVVATDCGGPKDFINADNGILIPKNDTLALTEALINIRKNILNYNKQNIAKNCIKLFSPEVIAKKLLEIYESVINK